MPVVQFSIKKSRFKLQYQSKYTNYKINYVIYKPSIQEVNNLHEVHTVIPKHLVKLSQRKANGLSLLISLIRHRAQNASSTRISINLFPREQRCWITIQREIRPREDINYYECTRYFTVTQLLADELSPFTAITAATARLPVIFRF